MSEYLCHHGVKGQKWGARKYQYRDGSLTPEGYTHYGYGNNTRRSDNVSKGRKGLSDKTKSRLKTAGKVALGVGAAAAVGYGAYKLHKASGRYNQAKAYAQAAGIASKLKDSHGINAKSDSKFAETARRAGNLRGASILARSAENNRIRSKMYDTLSSCYSKNVSELQNYGGKSDRIAYSFVEKIAKNRSVNWNDVSTLLDIDLD